MRSLQSELTDLYIVGVFFYMKLYTDGGSQGKMVVYPDGSQDYSGTLRFSRYVADHFNLEDCNYCENGGSNHRIARNLLEDISGYDAFIIYMTKKMRTEYHDGKKWIGVRADTVKQELKEQWDRYYKEIYSEKGALMEEKMQYNLIRLLLKETGKPYLIIDGTFCPLRINWKYMRQDKFFYKGHFTPLGHQVIANDLIHRMSSSTPSLARSEVMQCNPPSQK